ncbi:MAG: hypothetical protein WC002_09065, partial [Candidatus Muiribacteriota bacterium]
MKIKIIFFLIIVNLFIQADELFIFGNKTFDVKNVNQSGDFTRFFLENPDLKRGNIIEQSLRLKMMGEIARGISINAVFDDTKVQNDNHEITLFLTNGNVKGAFGDILTSFSHSDIIFFNKKTRGMELTDKNEKFYFLYALSEGKIYSEVFTGKGMLQEYRMFFYPLVRGSETVILDGKKLTKGTDYDIDYEDGSIFIETHLLPVESTSTLFINYEYMEDEKAFKRHVRGLSFRDYNSKYKIDYGLSFFVEEDSKKKLIEDDDNSLKPSSNSIWSFYTGLEKNNFSFDFEKAFGEKDNNLYSDVLAVDKPLKSENQHFNLRWKNNNLNLVSKFIKREPGFEIIGKKESDIKIDEKTSVLNFKDRLKSFSFEKSDIESIIYVDPFFGLTGNSPTVFNSSKDEFTYSFGNKVKVTGYERNNENLSSDNVLYNGKNSNLKLVVKQSSIFEYFFSKFTDVLENVTS